VIAAALALSLAVGAGLSVDAPQDAAPVVVGLAVDARTYVLPGAFAGVELGYGGALDTRNDAVLRASGKGHALATLGGRLDLAPAWQVALAARAGVVRVDGWPRGTLPALAAFGPLLGAQAALAWVFDADPLHPVSLELRLRYDELRLDGAWVGDPGAAAWLVYGFGG
jgi:hypothetical protein